MITILLAEDHTVVREGLRAVLDLAEGMKVVGEAEDGEQAVKLARELRPDVVLMDIAMPLMNGFEATKHILRFLPAAKILVLSSYNDEECASQLLEAGAAGYLIKQTAASDLLRAIQEIRRGNKFLSPTLARRLREPARPFGFGSDDQEIGRLTPREEEVLKLVAGGRSNRESALELGISIKTIEKHRQQVMNKLHIHETAGLTRYALSRGLISARDDNQELMKHA